MLSLSTAAILEKNKIASKTSWIILIEILLSSGETLRFCRNTENITWRTYEWLAFPFEIDDMKEVSTSETPQLILSVGNQTKAIQAYVENAGGGVGSTVKIYVIYTKGPQYLEDVTGEFITNIDGVKFELEYKGDDPVLELEYVCTGCAATANWVSFTLGVSNKFRQIFPKHKAYKNICRWKFKTEQCGFVDTDTLQFDTCNKTLSDCRLRQNSKRFGGFPSVGTGALYVD